MHQTLNSDDSIKKETKLYGLIAVEAMQEPLFAKLNKLIKPSAMMLPLNIREDDFYFTIKGLKDSKVSGVYIAKEYQEEVIELLDHKEEIVDVYNRCDFIIIKEKKLYGYLIQTNDITSQEALAQKIYTQLIKE